MAQLYKTCKYPTHEGERRISVTLFQTFKCKKTRIDGTIRVYTYSRSYCRKCRNVNDKKYVR